MTTFHCGREQLCAPCTELDTQSHKNVCREVGHLLSLHRPERFGEAAVRVMALTDIEGFIDSERQVTEVMLDATVESFNELIVNKL